MNFLELKKEIRKLYGGVLALESVISHKARKRVEFIFRVLVVFGLAFSMVLYISETVLGSDVTSLAPKIIGMTCFILVIWIVFFCLEAFYYSYFYLELPDDRFYIDLDLAKS